MSTDNANITSDKQIHLLDDLQSLLEKQIEMARKSNFRSVEVLAEQADSIVDEIVRTRAFKQAEFNNRRECLAKLYKGLELMLAAEKYHLDKQLQRISEGKKTLRAYRGND